MTSIFPEHDPARRVIQFVGADQPSAWPKAPSAYLCIFEAISLVGAAIFRNEWTGKELKAVRWPESPRLARPRALAGAMRPRTTIRPERMIGRRLIDDPEPSPEEFRAHIDDWYFEKRQRIWESNQQALARLNDTVEWIAQRCRDEKLVSFARLTNGGPLWPMRAAEWNLDEPLKQFVCHGGNKRYFVEWKQPISSDVFLFFRRDQFTDLLQYREGAPIHVSPIDLGLLSPYLQFAVRFALRKQYFSKSASETQIVREAEIRAAWTEELLNIPATENAIQMLAKLIGFPDPVAIERGKLARKKKTG